MRKWHRKRVLKPGEREKDRARAKLWREAHREKSREYQRAYSARRKKDKSWTKFVYGISPDEYRQLLALQDGKCAICKAATSRMQLDHNHKTGKIRKFLCHKCNYQLGWIESIEPGFEALAGQYLKENK